jgi:hypothetical protein
MSFKTNSSDVSIAQRALAMVAESKTISSLDDAGLNATAVKRWYKPVVGRLLEMHHWGLATKRSALVAVPNTRSTEWQYAYAQPDDMAFPVGFTVAGGAGSVSYYRGLAGLLGMIQGRPVFQHQSGVIYTTYSGDLEYVSYEITEADFNHTFEDIVVTMLASRLALELPKDVDLSDNLAAKAQTAINVAITNNLNAGNHKYGSVYSEAEAARGSMFGRNWDYIPLGPGQ